MNRLSVIFLAIVVGLASGIGGFALGKINTPNPLVAQLVNMPDGTEIVITEDELEKVSTETEYNGAMSEKIYFRMLSWAGLGGPEAAAGDQGITTDTMTVGASRGQSWIGGLWKFLKSIFWFIVLYFAFWMLFSALSLVYPPLGVVAKIMAAIATVGLSAIQGLFDWIQKRKTETALKQTVAGIDAAKKVNPEIKELVNTELQKAQDSNSKDLVNAIRK